MSKTVFVGALGLLCALSFSHPVVVSAASPVLVYQELLERWVVPASEAPTFATLEDARSKKAGDVTLGPTDGVCYLVRQQQGDWLLLRGLWDEEEFWAEASRFTDLDAYLKNPPSGAEVNCAAGKPESFRVDLDAGNKGAWVLIRSYPTMGGGGGIVEVWDSEKTKLLWQSRTLNKTGADNPLFCSAAGDQWVQFVGDIDGDGRAELVIKGAQSEMGPGVFTFWRWDGKAFVPAAQEREFVSRGWQPPGTLSSLGDKKESWNFLDGNDWVWVDDWLAARGDGRIEAAMTVIGKAGQGDGGKAVLRLDNDWKLVFESWITPPVMTSF